MHKSELQNFCEKKEWRPPLYATSKQGPDHKPNFIATVKVNDLTFQTPSACSTSKEAQNQAALLAFQHFSALDPSLSGIRRIYKNQLQQYAQVRELSLPVYSSDTEGPSHAQCFKAKVTVDGRDFESPDFFPSIKDAEQAAAKVALMSLLPDEEENQQSDPLPLEPISQAVNNMSITEPSSMQSTPRYVEVELIERLARNPPPKGFARKIIICPTHPDMRNIEGGTILPMSDDEWTAIEFPQE